ncbi:MAG: helix-turn-helix domain-containing protein [Aureliella sp.]
MVKKYIVTLTEAERAELQAVIEKRSAKSPVVKHAYVLLAADTMGAAMNDATIATTYRVSVRSVQRLRQRFIDDGFEIALNGKPQTRFRAKTFDGAVEAHLIALRCSEPPDGYAHWGLHLLADRMVALGYVETISHESVRQILKKTRSSLGQSNPG